METISRETKIIIEEHRELVNDVLMHHGVDTETCTLIRQVSCSEK